MSYQSLHLQTSGGVATLTLLGPGKGNAMGPEFWDELPKAADELTRDPAVRVILVRGSGDHFSYGLDLPRMLPRLGSLLTGTVMAEQRRDLMALIRHMQSGFQKLHESPKPVIAAVHGWCIGGGVNMIAACAIRLCSSEASFSLREARLAITPDIGGLQWLPGIIGEGYTRELAFTARDFDAVFAEKIRLVNHVYATPDELFAQADALARQIADNPAVAVQGAKAVLNYGIGKSIEDGLQYVAVWNSSQLQSADFAEAIRSTMERRKPSYNQRAHEERP